MKFKKAFAWILAVAMIISLMPSMAFATSTNSVTKTYTVAAEEDMPIVAIDLKVNDVDGLPAAPTVQKFKVSLENAEWFVNNPSIANIYDTTAGGTLDGDYAAGTAASANYGILLATTTGGAITAASSPAEVTINSVDTDFVTLTYAPATALPKDGYVRLYLALTSGSEAGEVKVSIDGMDSAFSSGTYTVATVSNNTTIANVIGDVKTYPRQQVTGAKIEITETAVNSISDDQIIKLTLPKGYSWANLNVTGDLVTNVSNVLGAASQPDLNTLKTGSSGDYFKLDDRNIYVYLGDASNPAVRESIILEPVFNVTKDASMGDINLTIAGYWADNAGNKVATASGLTIAAYGDESVTVSTVDEEELPQIVSGFIWDKDDSLFIAEVTIEENVRGALSEGRYIDFDFNDEAQIVTNQAIKYYVGTSSSVDYISGSYEFDENIGIYSNVGENLLERETNAAKDCSEFTIVVPDGGLGDPGFAVDKLAGWDLTKNNKLTLFIPITVKANYTGDITLNVSGAKAGIDETELVVAKAITPFTVETEVTSIINGAQGQATADIIITENVAGYLDVNDVITLAIDTVGLDPDSFAFDSANAAVTAGDLEIASKVSKTTTGSNTDAKNALKVTVKGPSTEVSTIELTNVVINMARNLPEGEYKVGTSLSSVENSAYDDNGFGKTVNKAGYVNNATVADGEQINESNFVIGETTFTVNGVEYEMDAAAYIDGNDRTMVPIRYFAMACGVSEDAISWDQASQTATINAPNDVIKITMGSDTIWVSSGNNIQMDTVAVNNDGRIYVPARYMANALGYLVEWDAATRTVSIY